MAANRNRLAGHGQRSRPERVEADPSAEDVLFEAPSGTFRRSKAGIFVSSSNGSARVCDSLHVKALQKSIQTGKMTVVFEFTDKEGAASSITVPRSEIAKPARLLEQLLDAGFAANNMKLARQVVAELPQLPGGPSQSWVTKVPGWQPIATSPVSLAYVAATTTYHGDVENFPTVRLEDGVDCGLARKGSLRRWNRKIARLCRGNSRLVFVVCAALAGPLLHLLGRSSFAFVLVGPSRTGKTTALAVAASVYGGPTYLETWDATSKALNEMAGSRNHGALILDEIGVADARTVAKAAYALPNGHGRRRLGTGGELQRTPGFLGAIIASGEVDLRSAMREAGLEPKAGQAVRLATVPVSAKGIAPKTGTFKNSAELVRALRRATSESYGQPGARFIRYLAENQEEATRDAELLVRRYTARLATCLPASMSAGLADSVVGTMAVIAAAGELAIRRGIIDWDEGDAYVAAKACLKAWARHEGEHAEMSSSLVFLELQQFFQSRSEGRFAPLATSDVADRQHLAGYVHTLNREPVYLVFTAYFERTLCRGFGRKAAIAALDVHGVLVRGSKGTATKQVRIPGAKEDCRRSFYVVRRAIVDA